MKNGLREKKKKSKVKSEVSEIDLLKGLHSEHTIEGRGGVIGKKVSEDAIASGPYLGGYGYPVTSLRIFGYKPA